MTPGHDAGSVKPSGRLRVGFDARWYNDSGVGTYTLELLKAMAVLNSDVEFVVYEDPRNLVPGLGEFPIQRVPLRCERYSIAEQKEIANRCRRDDLNVFHSPFYVAPLLARCPVIVTIHDLIPFLFPIYPALKRTAVKFGYRAAAWKSRHLITVSNTTAHDLSNILRVAQTDISVVPIGFAREYQAEGGEGELERLQRRYNLRPPYAVAASARNWRTKNLTTALQALQYARAKTDVDFQTLVYGPADGLIAAGGEDAWRGIGLRRAGFVEIGDLAMIFRHARFFIMPSLYEGFGLPILEAMACGCPVITSTGGSLPEVAGSGAQCFDPFDIAGMGQAALELLGSEEVHERWRVSALSRAKEFSWEKAARQTLSVYHRTYEQAYAPSRAASNS